MVGLLSAVIKFPEGSWWLASLVLLILKGVFNIIGSYGVAVLVFTLIIRLIMLPLDFANKYFTKKNSAKMAGMKPELDKIKQVYAGDMLAQNRAQQQVYKKNGYSAGGFCLFTIINLVVTLTVFITVYGALNQMSSTNLNNQYRRLQEVAVNHEVATSVQTYDEGKLQIKLEDGFKIAINDTYAKYNHSFLWVHNMFRPDTSASRVLSFSEYKSAVKSVGLWIDDVGDTEDIVTAMGKSSRTELVAEFTGRYTNEKADLDWWTDARIINQYKVDKIVAVLGFTDVDELVNNLTVNFPSKQESYWTNVSKGDSRIISQYRDDLNRAQYSAIVGNLKSEYKKGWNGMFLLVALAGVTTYFSGALAAKAMKKQRMEQKKSEPQVSYSMRDAKDGAVQSELPQLNPAMMGNMMKFMMPVVMVIFTLSTTAALALYISAGAVITALTTLVSNKLVDKIIAKQGEREKQKQGIGDGTIINPHARYFKSQNKK